MKQWKKLILSLSLVIGSISQVQGEERLVKVAFFPEMFGFYAMEENGGYSGYNHDYLMNVAEYTDWTYEYVVIAEGSIADSLRKAETMLINGELDLIGSVLATEDNLDLFEVGECNYGVVRQNLYSARNKYLITEDNYFLQENLSVALVRQYEEINEKFFYVMDGRGYETNVTYADSYQETLDLLLEEKVDVMISLDCMEYTKYLDYLTTIDRIPMYFISTKGNTELIAELDDAIKDIFKAEPDIHQRLLTTYFGEKYMGDLLLTVEEADILEELAVLQVGMLSNMPPYQYLSEEGELVGISIDIMEELSLLMGIDFQYAVYDNMLDLKQAVADKDCDMIATLPYNYDISELYGVRLSRPYLSSGVFWLKAMNPVAEPTQYYHLVSSNIPFYTDEELNVTMEIDKMIEQLSSTGDISIFCDPYVAQYQLDSLRISNVEVQTVTNVLSELSFGLGAHLNSTFLGTLNRAILHLDPFSIDEIIYTHTSVEVEYSLNDFFRDYGLTLYLGLILFFSILLYGIYRNGLKFKNLSRRDGMTHLYNSGYFHQFAEKKIPSYSSGTLILVDIDFFKEVNDTHGHQMGDEIIKTVAENMDKYCKPLGTVARLGGDEFVALIGGTVDKSQLEENSRNLLYAMKHNPHNIPVTLSIGGYMFEGDMDYHTLYKKADEVLYLVKEQGRNGYAFYSAGEQPQGLSSHCLDYEMFSRKSQTLLETEGSQQAMITLEVEALEEMTAEFGPKITADYLEVLGKRLKHQVKESDLLGSQGNNLFLLLLEFHGNDSALEKRVQAMKQSLEQEVSLQEKVFSSTIKLTLTTKQGGN